MDDGGAAGEAACPESDLASLTVAWLSGSQARRLRAAYAGAIQQSQPEGSEQEPQHEDVRDQRQDNPNSKAERPSSPMKGRIVIGRLKADPPADDKAFSAGRLGAVAAST